MTEAFLLSPTYEPHRDRTRAILKAHPEIRRLFGRDPWTFAFIAGLVGIQLTLAYMLRHQPWWLMLAVAVVVGAVITHALYVLMHECNHNLVFRRKWLNQLAGILANAPSVIPSCVSFQRYHLKHHAFQGVHEVDGDMASEWEARLVGNSAVRKALWLLFFPVFLALRPIHLRELKHMCPWTATNIVLVLGFDAFVWIVFGPGAIAYLLLAMTFSLGLHPVGARWISEHYVFHPPQETYSYYGPLNRAAFNIGFHNEHHDFPAIPWRRVPRVREVAPEWYDSLHYHTSWTRLLLQFIFDPQISLYSRVRRYDRGDGTVRRASTPSPA